MFPGLNTFPEGQILAFGLVFLRCIAFLTAWPVLGSQNIPPQAKVLLALILSVLLFPTLHFSQADHIRLGEQILFFAGREILVGLFLGFLLKMIFFTVSIAGDLIGISAGLASAQIFNPTTGNNSHVLEQLYVIIATLVLLSFNGHHLFLQGFAKSFEMVPVTGMGLKTQAFESVLILVGQIFEMGLRMAAPIMVAVLLTNLVLGVLGRAVPQVNVFVLSLQVTLIISFGLLILGIPLISEEVGGILNLMGDRMMQVMRIL